jgi:hypothetical protein
MKCTKPLFAYFDKKKQVVFNKPYAFAKGFNLPCGQCLECKLKRTHQWAVRCVHEAQMHEENCFITLTFNDYELVMRDQVSIDVKDFQNFMKKLRNSTFKKIRFFHCGEYGEKFMRPHYHAILFGYDFPDKILFADKGKNHKIYTSQKLQELWPYGFSTVGDVTFDSAAYVARYTTKKINGDLAEDHYKTEDGRTLTPEYCTMSRGNNLPTSDPRHTRGIGYTWFKKYQSDVYPHDYCEIDGKKIPPPRYYDELLKGDPEKPSQAYLDLKEKRLKDMEAPLDALDDPRWVDLKRIEDVRNYKFQRKKRELELDNSFS